ncbi:MAG: FG-GAP repeat domain-containing protein, partial [Nitrospiraceae bacterium]
MVHHPLVKRSRTACWLSFQFIGILALVILYGCSSKEPYVPPDLFYLFSTYKVGKNPTSVTTADLNQDGFTDLITTNIGNDSLSVLFGNGDGSFQEQKQMSARKEPRALALDDYNGDGLVDLAVACAGNDRVRLFFGLANGSFVTGQQYRVNRTPVAIATGDVNGDQKPDLVVAL